MRWTAEDVRRVVRAHLLDHSAATVVPLGAGLDNVAFEVDGRLVVRFARDPDPALVRHEAAVLAVAGRVAPVAVPRPVLVVPELGCLAYPRLPGVSLQTVRREVAPGPVAAVLAEVLAALHAVPPDELAGIRIDDEPLTVWLDDARAQYATARALVSSEFRPAVEAFLGAPAPAPPPQRVFSHDDLGIEHVLVDPVTHAVTGVIDWTDAGLVDPATDPGRVLRDLGPAAFEVVATRVAPGDEGLRGRALFYARCGALEDLAYGLGASRDAYVGTAREALAWLFPS